MIENAVFTKEIKTKMRSRHPKAARLAILTAVALFVCWGYYESLWLLFDTSNTYVRRDLWQMAAAIQGFLVWALAPALAANAITQEREQQTWEMLVFTRLRPAEIVLGKLAARTLPALGLLALFLPFMMACLAADTVTPLRVLATYVMLLVWTAFLVTMSLFMSWSSRRTSGAITLSYLVVFLLTVGTALINMTFSIGTSSWVESPVWWLSPVRAAVALFDQNDHYAAGVLVFQVALYGGLTALLLTRMVRRFRAVAVK